MPNAVAWHASGAWTILSARAGPECLLPRAEWPVLPAYSEYHELEDEFDLNPRSEEAAGGVPHQCRRGTSAGLSWLLRRASSSVPPPAAQLEEPTPDNRRCPLLVAGLAAENEGSDVDIGSGGAASQQLALPPGTTTNPWAGQPLLHLPLQLNALGQAAEAAGAAGGKLTARQQERQVQEGEQQCMDIG